MIINIRFATLFALFALVISSFLLFHTKHKVHRLRQELHVLQKKILTAKEDIHILQAEWSYLTQPDNIRRLAKRKLSLHSIDSSQVKSISKEELPKLDTILKEKHALTQDIAA